MDTSSPQPPARILAIDALRGFDMFFLTGGLALVLAALGLIYEPMPEWIRYHATHVEWEGFAAWDLVMPLFIFIVGAAVPFSMGKYSAPGMRSKAYLRIFRRVAILFLLGMVVQGRLLGFEPKNMALFCNTLQAIAGGYLIASLCVLHLRLRGQIVATLLLLASYWALMRFMPYGDSQAGLFLPHDNLALHIDKYLQGSWQDGTNYSWILTNLSFGATAMLGALSGYLLKTPCLPVKKLAWLLGIGGALLLSGWALSYDTPIIKHIFTTSLVLWAAGWSYLLLALFYLILDIARLTWLAFPFIVVGSNAIFAYMWIETPQCSPEHNISRALFGGLARQSGDYGAFIFQLGNYALIWSVLYFLYRKKTFIKV